MIIISFLAGSMTIDHLYQTHKNYNIVSTKTEYKYIEKNNYIYIDTSIIKWDMYEVTAYTKYDDGCNHITSIGVNLNKEWTKYFNFVAVDPDVVPYGSIVLINLNDEILPCLAVDTGADIQGYELDFYTKTVDGAKKFGRKNLPVAVIQ
jgi:3D (Asp-Asp-Asp) domain-containing protein